MKSLIRLSVILAALALCSCEEQTPEEPNGPAGGDEMAIKATLVSSATAEKAQWAKGDKITLFSDADAKGTELAAKAAGKAVEFEGQAIEGEKYYAVYPAVTGATFGSEKLTWNIPETVNNVDGALPAEYAYAGKGDFASGLVMTPVFTPVEVTINGTCSVASLAISGKDLTGKDVPMAGATEVDYSGKTLYANPTGGKVLTLNMAGLVVSGSKAVYLFAPIGQYSALTVTLTDADGNTKAAVLENVTLNAGQLQKATINHSAAINLSAGATSNCYMLCGAGNYSFATKKVDGSAVEGDAADWLWTSVECEWTPENDGQTDVVKAKEPMNPAWVISAVEYDKEKGQISFTTSGNPGNAVIALYRNDGSSRVIVWSWHVWVTDTPVDQMAVRNWQSKHLVDENISLTWLDRNIGAITAKNVDNAGIHGHLYQWGRKDPFPGAGKTAQGTVDADGKFTAPGDEKETAENAWKGLTMPWLANEAFAATFVNSGELKSVEDMAKYPMEFTNSGTTWANDVQLNAWGDGLSAYERGILWATGDDKKDNYTKTRRAAGPKSNNDPCPQGYRVPTAEELWNSFAAWDAGEEKEMGPDLNLVWLDNITTSMSKRNHGRLIKSYADPDNIKLRIPCSGMREGGVMKSAGKTCYYWTASIEPDNYYASSQKIYGSRWVVGTNLRFIGSTSASKAEGGGFGSARPVRCIAVQ